MDTKREAINAEIDFRKEFEASNSSAYPSFKELVDDWLVDSKDRAHNTTKTIKEKRGILTKRFSNWMDLPIDEISALVIRKRFLDPDIAELATETKNKYRIMLNAIFDFAVRIYDLPSNPIAKLPAFVEPESFDDKEMTTITPKQFQLFISQFEVDDDYRGLFEFIYWLGFRRSEALSLTFSDLQDGVLKVWKQWDSDDGKFRGLKNSSSVRFIRLPKHLMKIYERQLDKYSKKPGFSMDWFIFGGYKMLTRSTMDRRRKAAIKKAGLPYFTNHQLRHSYVTNLLDIESNAYKVSRSVGHASTRMTTEVYGHVVGGVSDFSDEIDSLIEESLKEDD